MAESDPKFWLRAARSAVGSRADAGAAIASLRDIIAKKLDRGESIADAVAAWDSLVRNPNDEAAAKALFLALDTGTAHARFSSGAAIGLGVFFTVQFKEDYSFQMSDAVILRPATVEFVTANLFRGTLGKPIFASHLYQLLQIEVAALTPDRLGHHLRADIKRSHESANSDQATTFIPPFPDGIIQIVNSKADPTRPHVIFTVVLPGYLWFENGTGQAEIETVWMQSGQLHAHYDFSVLDTICAKVQADIQQTFPNVISTKMNPVPLRFMTAGEGMSKRAPAQRALQRAALRTAGYR